MISENNTKIFPSSRNEVLALIYCYKHSTDETSPKELVEMYSNALIEIRDTFKELNSSRIQKSLKQIVEWIN